ncbi:MAG: hypothetical protein A3F30_00615 [Candidatus Levybacteria bacterium RIFCSPHIGHO2_12_FULL_37_12]|nr:MAG: hypothetical protein A3F30_00615 [Candidatus Levybacteria bacterium RIFCSPHIGHO2_12_FULL_37_12]
MVERLEHPVPPEPGSEHPRPPVTGEHPEHPRPHGPRPGDSLPHELGHRPPEPHDPRSPRPPEPGEVRREVELRPIAEDLITALESEDRELKIEAVVGVLSRFELKKPPVEPRPEHPRPPVHSEHPKPPRPHDPRP